MFSMTGYGSSKTSAGQTLHEISVKTVNSRFLEIRIHIPHTYLFMESDIKKVLKKYFIRGHIDVHIRAMGGSHPGPTALSINTDLAQQWLKAFKKLQSSLALKKEVPSLKEILNHTPAIIQVHEKTTSHQLEKEKILQLVQKSAKACLKERKREGQALCKDIQGHLDRLTNVVAHIEKLKEKANKTLAEKYKKRLKKLSDQGTVDNQRLAQEIVISVDKSDVSEEISRLKIHIISFEKLLKSQKSQGKKLDFYSQELLREVNTIGAKAQLSALTKEVIAAKSIIEQIREQVQNIE